MQLTTQSGAMAGKMSRMDNPMADSSVQPDTCCDRILTLEIVRVTERAAVVGGAAARPRR